MIGDSKTVDVNAVEMRVKKIFELFRMNDFADIILGLQLGPIPFEGFVKDRKDKTIQEEGNKLLNDWNDLYTRMAEYTVKHCNSDSLLPSIKKEIVNK